MKQHLLKFLVSPIKKEKFGVIAFAAKRAVDSNHWTLLLTVQLRIGTGAAFIDIDAATKTFEIMVFNYRIRAIVGDQIRKIPAGGGAGLESAIIPAGVEIQVPVRLCAVFCARSLKTPLIRSATLLRWPILRWSKSW